MRHLLLASACLLAAGLVAPGAVAQAQPEIERATGTAQAVGAAHTLRTIPEACARLEGEFTGDPAAPYRFAPVRTSPQCQARAQLVEYSKARPEANAGWVLNDIVRVPQAGCPGYQAVLRVWRLPVDNTPELDAQGRMRIYLEDARKAAAAGQDLPPVTQYAAELALEGRPCP